MTASPNGVWDGDPPPADEGTSFTTDDSTVSGDDGNYDDTDAADDSLADIGTNSVNASGTTTNEGSGNRGSSSTAPTPELASTASTSPACRGLVYEVHGGPGGYAMAATAATGGSGASSLEPTTSWQVGEGSGEFSWAYPFSLPSGMGDEAPQLGLNYSSGAVDGLTGSAPPQASQVGLGWGMDPGHISRTFAACSDDDTSDTSGDLCWRTETANNQDRLVNDLSLVLAGHSTKVIRDVGTGKLRLQDDPGWRVETWGGPAGDTWPETDGTTAPTNADGDDEAFRITSPDGTRYYFGFGTTSVWTVPVKGNNAAEPCNGQPLASPVCRQAWQWNLDRTVDADGNRVKYTYATESNYYKSGGTLLPYDRAGHVETIQYGFPRPSGNNIESTTPEAAVEIQMAGRCTASIMADATNGGDVTCTDQNAPRTDPKSWPDTPVDLLCGSSSLATCTNTSPAFFSLLRYKRIITHRGHLGDNNNPVSGPVTDRYVLDHTMPDPDGDGGDPPDLWLDRIEHQPTPDGGAVPVTAAVPAVQMSGDFFDNDVVPESSTKQLQKPRLTLIRNELGGRIKVTYGHQNACAQADITGKPAWNATRDCYAPSRPGGTDNNLSWYHKYLVKTLTVGDQALGLEQLANNAPSLGTIRQYQYTYRGDAGWRYDYGSKNTPSQNRSWSDWRGYQTTVIRNMAVDKQTNAGVPKTNPKSIRRVVVYRGLYNSRKDNSDALRQDTVPTVEHDNSLLDRNALRGQVAEETTLESPDPSCTGSCPAKWLTRTYHGYQVYRTASGALSQPAYFTGESLTRTHSRVTRDTGSRLHWDSRHTINYTFDPGGGDHQGVTLGEVTDVKDRGAGTSDNKGGDRNVCTANLYAANSDRWIRVLTDTTVQDQVTATTTSSDCTALLAHTTNYYDGYDSTTNTGANLTRGRLTHVDTYTDTTNKNTTRTDYDRYGRVLSTQDGRGFTTATAYNANEPNDNVDDLPVKVTTTTNQSTTVTRLEPRRGLPVSMTDQGDTSTGDDDAITRTTYDGYGRVLSVRTPNLNQAGGDPSVVYDYTVNASASAPARVKTTTRRDSTLGNRSGFDVSYTYLDGWGRAIETQTSQADGSTGRVVSATGYDELGQPYLDMPVIANSNAPGSGLLNASQTNVERHTLTNYDAASRITRVRHESKGDVERYSDLIKQQGDRTVTTQPVDGATVNTIDGWGRTIRVEQYANNTVDVAANILHGANYNYDGTNNLTAMNATIHGTVQTWGYSYDLAGQRLTTNDPDTGTSESTYDANGNQTSTSTPADGKIQTIYDNQDRPTSRFRINTSPQTNLASACTATAANDPTCTLLAAWTYDTAISGDGRLATATSYNPYNQLGTYIHAVTGYDLDGNVKGETYTYPDDITGPSPTGTLTLSNSYTYNDGDLVTGATYGAIGNLGATSVASTYAVNGQVDTMVASQPGQPNVIVLDATYDKIGQPLGALSSLPTNTNQQLNRGYTYDNATGRLTRISGTGFGTLDYAYDLIGNPTSATEVAPDTTTAAWCYTYDPLNRLKTAKTGSAASNSCATPAASTTLTGADQNLTYNYTDDRLTSLKSVKGGTTATSTYGYYANKAHQTKKISSGNPSDPALPTATSLAYDTAGRILTLTPTSGATTSYAYNPTGTVKTSTVSGAGGIATDSAYDPEGMRVARRDAVTGTGGYTSSVRYIGMSELTVKTPNGGTTVTGARRVYTTPGGTPLAVQTGAGPTAAPTAPVWTFQLGDEQQSLRYTRNQATNTDSRPTYRPFGQAITTSTDGERGFLNKPQDPNGDVRLDQRNYQPQLNVLTSPDPLLDVGDPQSLNPYAYATNNPLTFADPTGLYRGSEAHGGIKCDVPTGCDTGDSVEDAPTYTPAQEAAKEKYLHTCSSAYCPSYQPTGNQSIDSCIADVRCPSLSGVGLSYRSDVIGLLTYLNILQLGADPFTDGLEGALVAEEGAELVAGGSLAANGARGLSPLGGMIEETGANAAGGRIFTSTGPIAQNDFAGIVNSGLMRGDEVHILTGAHGAADGSLIADASLYADDVRTFGRLPGVHIYDVTSMSPAEIRAVLNGPGTIIGGFCDSGACIAPFGG